MMGILVIALSQSQSVFTQNRDERGRNRIDESRNLDYAINSLSADSRVFVKTLDRELDRSRYNGTRFEDEINGKAKRFRLMVVRFESAYRSGANERALLYHAERMLNQGADLNRMLRRADISRTVDREWSGIYEDLLAVARWHRSKGGNSNR